MKHQPYQKFIPKEVLCTNKLRIFTLDGHYTHMRADTHHTLPLSLPFCLVNLC